MSDQHPIQPKQLPTVGWALGHPEIHRLVGRCGHELAVSALRRVIELLRRAVLDGGMVDLSLEAVVSKTTRLAEDLCQPSLKPVINATGVVLHTNLGRAHLMTEHP